MTGRIEKSQKSQNPSPLTSTALAAFVNKFGVTMPRCSACFRANRTDCIVAEGKKRCTFCVEKKYSQCDFGGITNQARRIRLILVLWFYGADSFSS